jgi:hypothetical protein
MRSEAGTLFPKTSQDVTIRHHIYTPGDIITRFSQLLENLHSHTRDGVDGDDDELGRMQDITTNHHRVNTLRSPCWAPCWVAILEMQPRNDKLETGGGFPEQMQSRLATALSQSCLHVTWDQATHQRYVSRQCVHPEWQEMVQLAYSC